MSSRQVSNIQHVKFDKEKQRALRKFYRIPAGLNQTFSQTDGRLTQLHARTSWICDLREEWTDKIPFETTHTILAPHMDDSDDEDDFPGRTFTLNTAKQKREAAAAVDTWKDLNLELLLDQPLSASASIQHSVDGHGAEQQRSNVTESSTVHSAEPSSRFLQRLSQPHPLQLPRSLDISRQPFNY